MSTFDDLKKAVGMSLDKGQYEAKQQLEITRAQLEVQRNALNALQQDRWLQGGISQLGSSAQNGPLTSAQQLIGKQLGLSKAQLQQVYAQIGTGGNDVNPIYQPPTREAFNKDPAMKMGFTALRDLWAAKYGDDWIRVIEPGEDKAFWDTAFKRLKAGNVFECVDGWYRLEEGV